MANKKYLDNTGLSRMWSRVKSYLSSNYAKSSHTHTYSQITNLSTWKSNNFGSGSYSNSGTLSIITKSKINVGNESLISNYDNINWLDISSTNGIKLNDGSTWWIQCTRITNSWLKGVLINTEKPTLTELNVSDNSNAFEGIVPENERIYTTSTYSGKQYIKMSGAGDMFTTLTGSSRNQGITTKVSFTGSSETALYLICFLFSNSNTNGKISGPTMELYAVQTGNSINLSFSAGQTRLITGIVGYKV